MVGEPISELSHKGKGDDRFQRVQKRSTIVRGRWLRKMKNSKVEIQRNKKKVAQENENFKNAEEKDQPGNLLNQFSNAYKYKYK